MEPIELPVGLPRARGDRPSCGAAAGGLPAAPPRTRGSARHVGTVSVKMPVAPPRTRGSAGIGAASGGACAGSPEHAGIGLEHGTSFQACSGLPAHAGIGPSRRERCCMRSGLPRARGDRDSSRALGDRPPDFSRRSASWLPRTRGSPAFATLRFVDPCALACMAGGGFANSRGSAAREGAARRAAPRRLASPCYERCTRSDTACSRRPRVIGIRGRSAFVVKPGQPRLAATSAGVVPDPTGSERIYLTRAPRNRAPESHARERRALQSAERASPRAQT